MRLLVTDDRAYDILAAALPDARAGVINVFAAAERCAALVDNHPAWAPNQATAVLLAAVDGEGIARATSAYGAFGTEASVMFVNTHPDGGAGGSGRR